MRLFIAVELSEEIKAELRRLQSLVVKTSPSLRLTTPEQMHITLKFLGDTPDETFPQVQELFHTIVDKHRTCSLSLSHTGCFPPRGKVRVVWVGVDDPDKVLAQCAASFSEEFASLGYPSEKREFTPHVTLARVKKAPENPALREYVGGISPERLTQNVESISLIESVLGPEGAEYHTLTHGSLK